MIITYAKFGMLLEKIPDFHTHFDYIICDELHSLIKFQYFSAQPNSHSIAKKGIERAVNNRRTTVVALSATPERIQQEFDTPQNVIPIDDDVVVHYETQQISNYTNLEYLITSLNPDETGICYVSRISTMKAIEEQAQTVGLRPVCIWSINNHDHPMNQEQLDVRESVLKRFEIPPAYNFLIINASSETSLKIKSHVDYVIVHSGDYDT